MSRVTKFAARDAGPDIRIAGFMAHLREQGLRLGVKEAEIALKALTHIKAADPSEARLALRAICTGCADESARFDDLFDSYWMNGGRVRTRITPTLSQTQTDHVHSARQTETEGEDTNSSGQSSAPDGGTGDADSDGIGKLIATEVNNLMKMDLRNLVQPAHIAEAQRVAEHLGAALRDRRSRRRKAALKGDQIHFRKVIRQSLATGGEPLALPKRRRPERPRRISAICDVSGSMSVYAQVFLAFLAGLMRADPHADAYLFHTRLVRITEALRDKDALRALARMSLMADGFAGGSRIGMSLDHYARTYAKHFVDGRSVVLILSDGYDTDPPDIIAAALERLKKRGGKVIWLNPLKGWANYEPTAAGMRAALPHLDLFSPANTLADLAALEPELASL